MNNEKETISKEEAAAILKSVDSTKRDAIKSFRIPLLLIAGISNSYSLVVFSWGMTEHENMWALGMYIGAASFGIFASFTDVSSTQFGEGSFDKGITFRIPIPLGDNFLNYAWRPLTKDPGQKLNRKNNLHDLLVRFQEIN